VLPLLWRDSLIPRKAPLKKSISAACRPVSCSNSEMRLVNVAMWSAVADFLRGPLGSFASAWSRHLYSHFRRIPSSLASAVTLLQAFIRSSALRRNSGLYFLHP
jgi:hypothetical protein